MEHMQGFRQLKDSIPHILSYHAVLLVKGDLIRKTGIWCNALQWYMTTEKLEGFIANDTKYRQLKLDSANKRLQTELDVVDSLYQVNPDLRDMVIQNEERNRKNLEMLQKAVRMESEANELKKKVNKSK